MIANNLANSGSYDWTVPNINSAQVILRISAVDKAGNAITQQSVHASIIDSIAPAQTITHAGSGGSTPVSGTYINTTGFDISAQTTDTYLATVAYRFVDVNTGNSWNGSGWTQGNVWNTICADGANLGTDHTCDSTNATITPSITDGMTYTLVIRSLDEAGNATLSPTYTYIGDTVAPSISTNLVNNAYFSGSVQISGTAVDTGSSLSTLRLEVKKGSQYWDGSSWSDTPQSLLPNTTDGYAHWNYTFIPPLGDADNQDYTVTASALDGAYKTGNSASLTRTIIKDTLGPIIASNVFTFSVNNILQGGQTLNITWDPSAISATGANLATDPITLAYNLTGAVTTIATNIPNTGSYSLLLPQVDTTTAKIIISATDTLGNSSNTVSSSDFTIDSTPPSIVSVQTLDQSAS